MFGDCPPVSSHGYWNDDCDAGQEIYDWREVYVEDVEADEYTGDDEYAGDEDSTFYDILDDRFEI